MTYDQFIQKKVAKPQVHGFEPGPLSPHLEESSELLVLIPDAVEVRGSDKPEHKERKLRMFQTGDARVIVTKPSIAGFGLNWQHCHQDLYVGLNHSWERFYQGGKRIHRFGQTKTVQRYIIQTDLEDGVLANLTRKQRGLVLPFPHYHLEIANHGDAADQGARPALQDAAKPTQQTLASALPIIFWFLENPGKT